MREYDKYEEDCANSNRSTKVLQAQLENKSNKNKIIITTIRKLSVFIKKNINHDIYKKHVVIIFDECHRSQFGEMHKSIVKNFKKYHLFGFTGTPIFKVNKSTSSKSIIQTTEQAFGDKLHTYNIVDAIRDGNVLPFKVDYIKTFSSKEEIEDESVWDIDRERVYADPRRISKVVKYILDNFDKKTFRGDKTYKHSVLTNIGEVISNKKRVEEKKEQRRVKGFNSIFAVSSISMAKLYYKEFKKQLKKDPNKKDFKIGLIYSYGVNEDTPDFMDEENSEDTNGLQKSDRDFLESAIKDYNNMFNTNFDTSKERFQNYYKDISLRVKNKELDLLIVVNMFLTGFDATTLNTLWVDKNLRMHGLIQAFSRTNRILNSIKVFGNIICFRNLEAKTDEALSVFGDKDASGIVLIRNFKDFYEGYKDSNGKHQRGYKEMVEKLFNDFPLTLNKPVLGETKQKQFINLFSAILRMRNILSVFDEWEGKEIIEERDFQDYSSWYLDLRDEIINEKRFELKKVNDDIVFELELIKQNDINIDYILMLVQQYKDSHKKDNEIIIKIQKAVNSSPELRSKKALIENFVKGINEIEDVLHAWKEEVAKQKEERIKTLIATEKLDNTKTRKFVREALENDELRTTGTAIAEILPPMTRFGDEAKQRSEKKKRVISRLKEYFEIFRGI